MKKKNDLEKTDDFTLAITLICLGYEPLLIEPHKTNKDIYDFTFDKTEAIERLIKGYSNNNLLVEPKRFLKARKEIHERVKNLETT